MFKLSIKGENDKIVKTYETSSIKYGLIEDMVMMSKDIKGKNSFEQFTIMKPMLKTMFTGITDDELRNADFIEVLKVIKQLMKVAENGFGDEEKN